MEPRTSIAWEPLASLGCGLAFQWVDVTRVQPGIYRLRAEADPDGAVREEQEANSPELRRGGLDDHGIRGATRDPAGSAS